MVHFDSHINSTLFTNCCNTAILDRERFCPGCRKEITLSPRARWEVAMQSMYGPRKRKNHK